MEVPLKDEKVRLDKWLWAARFYKTRALAHEAIEAGHVKIGGDRAKPAQPMRVGLVIAITKEGVPWEICVRALTSVRGKGKDAAELYEETESGAQLRQEAIAALRLAREHASVLPGRPTKRDRRAIDRFRTTHFNR